MSQVSEAVVGSEAVLEGTNDRFSQARAILKGQSFKARALRGSAWTIAGYGAGQVLRLGSNLILTRLLFPEAFGLMALVNVFMQGLAMFSDVGIGPSIIQNKRGDDPDFLNTAWTIQVIRGFVLWLCSCLIAWPVAQFYGQPMLAQLIPAVGLTALIAGFNSTKLFTANRHLALGRLTGVELSSQVVGIVSLIALAWWLQTVWALVMGGLIATAVKTILGHTTLPGPMNRFRWDPTATKALFSFGRWIFIATFATFLGGKGLQMIQGILVPIDVLGIIAISSILAFALGDLVQKLGQNILFPGLSEIARNRPNNLRKKLFLVRMYQHGFSLPAFAGLIISGPLIIDFLYDDRYIRAGLFLPILATARAVGTLRQPYNLVFMACGQSKAFMAIQVYNTACRIPLMVIGYYFASDIGMLIGMGLNHFAVYPIEAVIAHRLGVWQPLVDVMGFTFILFSAAVSLMFYA